jgi:hypothetical protein
MTVAEFLGTLSGRSARVSMDLLYDPGHGSQHHYSLSILAPKPISNPISVNGVYSFALASGHRLNPGGLLNKLLVTAPTTDPATGDTVTFDLVCDGTLFLDIDQRPYVFAIISDGPDVPLYPAENGAPPRNTGYYLGVDINLYVPQPPPLTARLGTVKSHFTPRYPAS